MTENDSNPGPGTDSNPGPANDSKNGSRRYLGALALTLYRGGIELPGAKIASKGAECVYRGFDPAPEEYVPLVALAMLTLEIKLVEPPKLLQLPPSPAWIAFTNRVLSDEYDPCPVSQRRIIIRPPDTYLGPSPAAGPIDDSEPIDDSWLSEDSWMGEDS